MVHQAVYAVQRSMRCGRRPCSKHKATHNTKKICLLILNSRNTRRAHFVSPRRGNTVRQKKVSFSACFSHEPCIHFHARRRFYWGLFSFSAPSHTQQKELKKKDLNAGEKVQERRADYTSDEPMTILSLKPSTPKGFVWDTGIPEASVRGGFGRLRANV